MCSHVSILFTLNLLTLFDFSISQAHIQSLRNYCATQFSIMNRNMNRYYQAPARPIGRRTADTRPGGPAWRQHGGQARQALARLNGAAPGAGLPGHANTQPPNGQQENQAPMQPRPRQNEYQDPTAVLGKPRTLLSLWHEFVHGNDGRKAAGHFTHEEKGRCRFKYSRRLPFWEVMDHLIRNGHTDLSAVDLLKQCYGQSISVTAMCKELANARRTGNYHPNLNYHPNGQRRGSRHYPAQQQQPTVAL
jgi:hypothetical protein